LRKSFNKMRYAVAWISEVKIAYPLLTAALTAKVPERLG
jgi:hypothetical protein